MGNAVVALSKTNKTIGIRDAAWNMSDAHRRNVYSNGNTKRGGMIILFAPPFSHGFCPHRDRATKTATGGGVYLEDDLSLSSQNFASTKP